MAEIFLDSTDLQKLSFLKENGFAIFGVPCPHLRSLRVEEKSAIGSRTCLECFLDSHHLPEVLGMITMGEVHTADAHAFVEQLASSVGIVAGGTSVSWVVPDGADELGALEWSALLVDDLVGIDVDEVVADDASIAVQTAAQTELQGRPTPEN